MPRQGEGVGDVLFTQDRRRFDLWWKLMGRDPINWAVIWY